MGLLICTECGSKFKVTDITGLRFCPKCNGTIDVYKEPQPEADRPMQIPAVVRSQAFCIISFTGNIEIIFDNLEDAEHYMNKWNSMNEGTYHCELEIHNIKNGKYKYKFREGVDYGPIMVDEIMPD